jgi:hypothetical protein
MAYSNEIIKNIVELWPLLILASGAFLAYFLIFYLSLKDEE